MLASSPDKTGTIRELRTGASVAYAPEVFGKVGVSLWRIVSLPATHSAEEVWNLSESGS